MSFQAAQRLRQLPNYPFVEINATVQKLQTEGRSIIRMDMGSPDLPPPPHVIETMTQALRQPKHGYSGYKGTAAFRQAVARYYERLFGLKIDPETQVLPLLGSKEGLTNLALATISRGDIVLVPAPGYPAYEMSTILAEGEVYEFPLTAQNRFLPKLEDIPSAVAKRARLLWVNYPNNPTGALASPHDYAEWLAFCREYDILLASDNPYLEVIFDGSAPTSALQPVQALEHAVEFISLSKSHNMAGWRIGACVGQAEAIAALLKVKSNMDSGHFIPIYESAGAALDHTPPAWTAQRNETYRQRFQVVLEALDSIGLLADSLPKGSIYLWARVKHGDDVAYCRSALHEAGVSLTPGAVYGKAGAGYIRMSLVQPQAVLHEMLERLQTWYARTQGV